RYHYTLGGCASPSPTPTATATATASPTPTATATATATVPPPTPTPCVNYSYTVLTGAIVPGVDDTGNHGDDVGTTIALPFSYTLYDQVFTMAHVGSNGHVTFGTAYDGFGITCLPESSA